MSNLNMFLDHWIIHKQDGTFVLNGKYEEFVKGLELQFGLEKVRLIDEAAKAISMLKINVTEETNNIITGR